MSDVDYDPASRILSVRFADGDRYSYFDVPASVHADLMTAESHGRFFQAHIRDAYRYRRS